jgi:hypothetical protein
MAQSSALAGDHLHEVMAVQAIGELWPDHARVVELSAGGQVAMNMLKTKRDQMVKKAMKAMKEPK